MDPLHNNSGQFESYEVKRLEGDRFSWRRKKIVQ